jgi:hypothetical protein
MVYMIYGLGNHRGVMFTVVLVFVTPLLLSLMTGVTTPIPWGGGARRPHGAGGTGYPTQEVEQGADVGFLHAQLNVEVLSGGAASQSETTSPPPFAGSGFSFHSYAEGLAQYRVHLNRLIFSNIFPSFMAWSYKEPEITVTTQRLPPNMPRSVYQAKPTERVSKRSQSIGSPYDDVEEDAAEEPDLSSEPAPSMVAIPEGYSPEDDDNSSIYTDLPTPYAGPLGAPVSGFCAAVFVLMTIGYYLNNKFTSHVVTPEDFVPILVGIPLFVRYEMREAAAASQPKSVASGPSGSFPGSGGARPALPAGSRTILVIRGLTATSLRVHWRPFRSGLSHAVEVNGTRVGVTSGEGGVVVSGLRPDSLYGIRVVPLHEHDGVAGDPQSHAEVGPSEISWVRTLPARAEAPADSVKEDGTSMLSLRSVVFFFLAQLKKRTSDLFSHPALPISIRFGRSCPPVFKDRWPRFAAGCACPVTELWE